MNEEEIKKAAKETLVNKPINLLATKVGSFMLGFIAGAKWRINSVWHDGKVAPDRNFDKEVFGCGEDVILKPKHRQFIEICEVCWDEDEQKLYFDGGREIFLMEDVEFWAYVSDLLPERKGGTE